ncbi:hypothetical protein HanRHA438_Chr08g0341681 [Helianthus annuus]|nr:hypothetical protein HanHA89_Chr08g0290091 [Helianthus annuus]KAJ0718559.1 hypothetical protein HanLR1_Chr08g0271951 [Helianthus annuus]KAJ0897075.1 hypothetical protein HanRHA438_Chr08g0341681 [Helianthus annuus]
MLNVNLVLQTFVNLVLQTYYINLDVIMLVWYSEGAYGHFSKLEVQFWTFRYFGEALCGNCRTYIGTKTTHLDDAIFLFSFSVTWAIFHVY